MNKHRLIFFGLGALMAALAMGCGSPGEDQPTTQPPAQSPGQAQGQIQFEGTRGPVKLEVGRSPAYVDIAIEGVDVMGEEITPIYRTAPVYADGTIDVTLEVPAAAIGTCSLNLHGASYLGETYFVGGCGLPPGRLSTIWISPCREQWISYNAYLVCERIIYHRTEIRFGSWGYYYEVVYPEVREYRVATTVWEILFPGIPW